MNAEDDPGNRDRDERVSLAGLDPEDALRALLKVDPDAEPVDTESGQKDRLSGQHDQEAD